MPMAFFPDIDKSSRTDSVRTFYLSPHYISYLLGQAVDYPHNAHPPTPSTCTVLLQGHTALVCQLQLVPSALSQDTEGLLVIGGSDGQTMM